MQSICVPCGYGVGPVRVFLHHLTACAVGLVLCASTNVLATQYFATPETYRTLLSNLAPGDVLKLKPGVYRHGMTIRDLHGSSDHRIIIQGPRSGRRAVFHARPNANTVTISNSSYVELRNIEIDGRKIPVHGVVAEGSADFAHHIVLEGLYIHNFDANQQIDGISTKCPTWNWVIRNNVIVGVGTGMYLGQSDGTAPFVAGLIENNVIADSIGYNLQIKHQRARPRIEGMPEDKNLTVIRRNVFSKSGNSATGTMARPNVLVGHWPPEGPGAEDTYAIYGNFFYQNPTEALFQGEGNIAFYSNVLVNTFGDAINIRPHNRIPRRIDVFRNTVLAANAGIRITGGDPAFAQQVIANVVFAGMPILWGDALANRTGSLAEAAESLTDPFSPPGQLDVSPRPGMLISVPYEVSPQSRVPDAHRDFDGSAYRSPIAGAYAGVGATRRLTIKSQH